MSAERLREMLSEANPGPWLPGVVNVKGAGAFRIAIHPADARLIALAPDAIALLADMGEALELLRTARGNFGGNAGNEALTNDLLARLDALCGDER